MVGLNDQQIIGKKKTLSETICALNEAGLIEDTNNTQQVNKHEKQTYYVDPLSNYIPLPLLTR